MKPETLSKINHQLMFSPRIIEFGARPHVRAQRT